MQNNVILQLSNELCRRVILLKNCEVGFWLELLELALKCPIFQKKVAFMCIFHNF